MRLAHLSSFVLCLALTVSAGVAPRARIKPTSMKSIKAVQEAGITIRNFLISDVRTHSVSHSTKTKNATKTSISFLFNDLNSNTSSICSDSWAQTNATSTAPFDFIACNVNNAKEFFLWQFNSFSSIEEFQIQFAHGFIDSEFPPSSQQVEFQSSPTNFTLKCPPRTGGRNCVLPAGESPVEVPVTGISG